MKLFFLISVCALVCLAALTAADSSSSSTPRQANCENFITDACTRELMPVCGDDGETYSNECELCVKSRHNNKNVMVVNTGECAGKSK